VRTDPSWERRRAESERLWAQIRQRIEELDRASAEDAAGEDLAEVWQRRALDLARDADRERDRGETIKLVVFRLGADRYAVRITSVLEIQKVGRITPLPTAPAFVTGVINLRGVVLSVLDLRAFFGLEQVLVGEGARILVAEGGGMTVGLLVEQVEEIADVPSADVRPPLAPSKGIAEDYVSGIVALRGGQMVVLVDLDRILRNPRIVVDETV
jgi:purine-binding chemotaxis protein CheW